VKPFAANVMTAGVGLLGAAGLSLLVTILVARVLGAEEFGLYGFAFAYVAIWTVVMDGGAVVLATRDVARGRAADVMPALFTLKPVLIGVAFVGLMGAGWLAGFSQTMLWLVGVFAIGSAADAYLMLTLAVFRGREEFGIETLHLLAQRLVFALFAFAALAAYTGAIGVAVARAASLIAAMLSASWVLRHRHAIKWTLSLDAVRASGFPLLASVGPLLFADLMMQLQSRGGPLILQFTRGPVEVGLYTAPARLIEGLFLFPAAYGVALLPRLVTAYQHGGEPLRKELRTGLQFAGSLGVAVAISGLVWADELTVWLFGQAYASSVVPFRVLLGALLVMMINVPLRTALLAVNAERSYAISCPLAATTNLIFNIGLTPRWGTIGSAWASLGSETLLCVGLLLAIRGKAGRIIPLWHWTALAFGSMGVFALLWAVKSVSPVAAIALTIVIVIVGFERMSPIGVRDFVRLRSLPAGPSTVA